MQICRPTSCEYEHEKCGDWTVDSAWKERTIHRALMGGSKMSHRYLLRSNNNRSVVLEWEIKVYILMYNNWRFIKQGSARRRSALKYHGWIAASESDDDVPLLLLLPDAPRGLDAIAPRTTNDCCDAPSNDREEWLATTVAYVQYAEWN